MNTFFVYLLEASVCLGVFYLFYLAVLCRQPSFQYNRVYLLATSAVGWILPLLRVSVGSASPNPATSQATAYLLLSSAEVGDATTTTVDLALWAGVAYGLGVLVMLVLNGRQFYRLYRVVRTSRPQPVPHNRYRLLYTNGQLPTSSFFRYLFWDNTQPLTVEETHIRQGHSYDVLYMTLLKIIGGMEVRMSKQGNLARGTIFSEDGDPLPGANIAIEGTNRGTVTNIVGKFALQLDDEDNKPVVVVSFVGYQSEQIEL